MTLADQTKEVQFCNRSDADHEGTTTPEQIKITAGIAKTDQIKDCVSKPRYTFDN